MDVRIEEWRVSMEERSMNETKFRGSSFAGRNWEATNVEPRRDMVDLRRLSAASRERTTSYYRRQLLHCMMMNSGPWEPGYRWTYREFCISVSFDLLKPVPSLLYQSNLLCNATTKEASAS